MEVVRNREPNRCCRWPRGERGGGRRSGSRVIFFYGEIVCIEPLLLLLLLLCEYGHYNTYYSELKQCCDELCDITF